jgi:hypothetical protein
VPSDWSPFIVDAYMPALMVAKPAALITLRMSGYWLMNPWHAGCKGVKRFLGWYPEWLQS